MNGLDKATQRLIAVFMAGCVLFNYPILALFNVPARLFGVPILYLYLFAAWALVIGAMAIIIDRSD